MSSKFAVAAMVGGFRDTAEFVDPIQGGTTFTVRRAGSNKLQELARERAKKNKIAVLGIQAVLAGGQGAINQLTEKAGINPVDVLAHYSAMKMEDALLKLVSWQMDNGTPYNAENARELLSMDGPLEKSVCPPAAWELLEAQARKDWEALQEAMQSDEESKTPPPFKGIGEDIPCGEAYQLLIRYWSAEKEGFRVPALEEAAKN